MIIPLKTDHSPRRTPIVTHWLLFINLLIYAIGLAAQFGGLFDLNTLVLIGRFDPQEFRLWQLITYQFLHDPGAIWHLAFNMLFLWVFGCPVEDRLGRRGFLAFYLLGGVAAGLAHMMMTNAPVIGASGSIAAVTGAFLALFPRSRILVLFLIFPIILPALWIIGLFFMLDLLRQVGELLGAGGSRVAYAAHLAGYVYGFGVCFALLAGGLIKRHDVDVFFLLKQSRRRAAFRQTAQQSRGGIWDSPTRDAGEIVREHGDTASSELTGAQQAQADLRAEIHRLIAAHDLPAAGRVYRKLLAEDPGSVLPETRQLDLANQFYSEGDTDHAAQVYELFLKNYPQSSRSGEVRLMLGMLYTRQLQRPQDARPLLERAREQVARDDYRHLAEQLLTELPAPQ